jgi:hypothetical protein
MKYLFCLLLTAFSIAKVTSQYVGLTNKEVANLKKMIKKEGEVRDYVAAFKKIADTALIQTPNPIDTVVSEGHLANHPQKIITVRALKDINKMYALAISYRIDGNMAYLNKLVEFLLAWATINKPQGNPINDTKFEDLFTAYDLVRHKISSGPRKTIDDWLVTMASEEIRTGKNKARATSFNNWNSHRLKVIGCIGYILGNDGFKKYIDEELPVQIEKNLLPDGSGIDFLERDALHYHVYTLEPLIKLATVLQRASGKDFYTYISPSGASIGKSVDFLIPYVTGEKTHGEYVNSKVAFDKKRADNKEAGFEIGANFKPDHGVPVIMQAAYFDPSIMGTIRKAIDNNKIYPQWQAVLNKVYQ